MKRALLIGLALGFGLALVSLPGIAAAGQPAGEFALMLRLNGSPAFIGHTAPGGDGGTVGRVDGGVGNCVKTQCYSPACVCAATSCSCGTVLASSGAVAATNGEYLAAYGVSYMCLAVNNGMVTTAAASGSLLLDGGAGADCDHWVMQ